MEINSFIKTLESKLKENFIKAKEFLHKNVKSYSDSLKRIVMENK